MEKASLFLVILSLSSCLFDYSYTKQITGPYELSAVDEKEAMSIYADDKVLRELGIIVRQEFELGTMLALKHNLGPNKTGGNLDSRLRLEKKKNLDDSNKHRN